MAQKLETDIVLNLAGNLAAKARQYGNSMSDFAKRNEKAMTLVKKTTAAAGRGIDTLGNRYVGAIAAMATGVAAKNFATLDRRLSRLAIAANISRDAARGLFEEIQKVSNEKGIRIDPEESLSAIEEILTKTGDLDYAITNLPNIAAVIQATGAAGQQVGGVFTEFKKLAIEGSDAAMQAIDILNKQGKDGAFTLASMASLGPRIFAAYAATGRQGVESVTELGAALQVIRSGVGSDEQAVTSFEALIRDITEPKRVEMLKKLGNINVFDPEKLKQGVEVMRPLPELMEDIMVRSKGLSTNLAPLAFTDEAKRALNVLKAEFAQTGNIQSFDKFMNITGDGSVTLSDAAVASEDFAASIQLLNNSLDRFVNSRLAGPIEDIANAINSVDDETVQNWLKWGETALWVVGGLVAAKKGLEVASDLKNIFGKKPGASGGGAGGFADLGVMPVYVTNMGAGGMGGPDITDVMGGDGKGPKGTPPKKASIFNLTNAVAATTIGYGLSMVPTFSPIDVRRASEVDKAQLPEGFPVAAGLFDVIDDFKRWFSSGDNAASASDSIVGMQKGEMKLKVEVSDDRVKVTPTYLPKGFTIDPDTGAN
jgi:hypothetical protein